ncbi:MAG: hotdog domain-containing protein [Nitrososphaerota archaeon]
MSKTVSIRDTVTRTWHHVMPVDTNPLSKLHGGRIIDWMLSSASVACMRYSRGGVVLGAVDSLFFLRQVGLWNLVEVKSFIGYSGRSSMEVGVVADSLDLKTGEWEVISVANMAFVAVDGDGRPRPIPYAIKPDEEEYEIYAMAEERYRRRREALAMRDRESLDITPYAEGSRFRMLSSHTVTLSDTLHGVLMFGGRLLHMIDEMAAALVSRYCSGVVVTGAVDSMLFYHPIRVGMLMDVELAINHVGETSAEVGAKVVVENPLSGIRRHATTAFFTFIHLGDDSKPRRMPAYTPITEDERRRYEEAGRRYLVRREKLTEASRQAEMYRRL